MKSKIISKTKKIGKWLKDNYKSYTNSYVLVLFFVLFALINSTLLRVILLSNDFRIKAILADLAILLILSSPVFFMKPKKQFGYIMTLTVITTILCIVQSAYYTYYSSFASVSLLTTSVFLADMGDAVIKKVVAIKDFIYLWDIIAMYLINRKLKKKGYFASQRKVNKKVLFSNFLILAVIIIIVFSSMVTRTEWSRFNKLWNRESVVVSFGIYTYQINDIVQSLQPKFSNIFGLDKALKEVNDFYDNRKIEEKDNKYTNIFEGKNVIAIHAESMQSLMMNMSFYGKEVTPNLNKLAREGIFFSNFYSQVGVGTSSDAEFTYATSLMPSSRGTVFVNYFNNEYVTIQRLLKQKGYNVYSMHGNVGKFWNRDIMHKNMGYDKFYSKDDYEIDEEIGLGLSDKSFFKQSIKYIKDIKNSSSNPYYITMITLSNHTPFNDLDKMPEYPTTETINIDGEEVVRDYINNTTLGNYIRSVHYADEALGEFISSLDENDLLENTVIVIYGDHDARIERSNYEKMYNYDPYTDSMLNKNDMGYIDFNEYEYEINKNVPFIIWTKDKTYTETVNTPMGMIDVLPTLGNMLGVSSKYSLGTDVFDISNGDNTIVFTDGSYLTSKIYYNAQNGDIYPRSNEVIDESYINDKIEYSNKIIEISNNITAYNLIKEIEDRKKEIK